MTHPFTQRTQDVLSFLKRKEPPAASGAVDEAASVQAARTRARRRLIGAAVLVGLGIVGFPLLFETHPRPIAVDIPIEIATREGAASQTQPVPKDNTSTQPRVARPSGAERAADAPVEAAANALPASAAAPAASAAPRVAAASAPARATAPPAAAASRAAVPPPEAQRDAQRAQALLEGKPAAALGAAPATASAPDAKSARFVVQAGAYTDAAALREARQKVERLGMKTYTQVVETDTGARTRVRVGPFATRDEAEAAAARIKGSGLAVSVLSL